MNSAAPFESEGLEEMPSPQMIKVDGRDYPLAALAPEARVCVANIAYVDDQIRRLQKRIEIYQTAREAFAITLQAALPKD